MMTRQRRYLVVSDLHLCDTEDHADRWMAHKHSRWHFDGVFGEMLRGEMGRAEGDGVTLTVVFNGDVVDFDLVTAVPETPPWPVRGAERRRGLEPTAPRSAWKLRRILQHHPEFVERVAEMLQRGHRLVYVLGNHDRELHFGEVRRVLLDAVDRAARALGWAERADTIRFEPWFFHVPGEIYVEHGQQYDSYSSFQHLLDPVVERDGEPTLALPMGNVTNRFLLSRMGHFNPFSSDFMLSVWGYMAHWFRHYALSRRGILLPWAWGSLQVMVVMLGLKRRLQCQPAGYEGRLQEVSERNGVTADTAARLLRLQHPPVTERFSWILRELWLDRLAVVVGTAIGVAVLAVIGVPWWGAVAAPLLTAALTQQMIQHRLGGTISNRAYKKNPEWARRIAALLDVPLVTFGHTHEPGRIALPGGATFVDTGAWAPIPDSADPTQLASGFRNVLRADFGGGAPDIAFFCYGEDERAGRAERGDAA